MYLLLFGIKMHVWYQWLQLNLGFSVKGDIGIGERLVFIGECHLTFCNAGTMWHTTSLKNEKPSRVTLACLNSFSYLLRFSFKGTAPGDKGEILLTTVFISLTTGRVRRGFDCFNRW